MNHTVWLILLLWRDAAALCGEGWHESQGRCYYVSPINETDDYAGAVEECDSKGAYVASVTTQEIMDYIILNTIFENGAGCIGGRECNQNYEFWIGLTKNISSVRMKANITELRTDWIWKGGQSYDWQNWRDGEPAYDEGWARMRGDGSWGGTLKREMYRYICEQATNDSEESTPSTTTTLRVTKRMTNTTLSPRADDDSDPSIYLYVGPAIGVVVVIAIVGIVIVLCRKRRAAKDSHQSDMYYNTRGDLNNHSTLNPKNSVNQSPLASGPLYAEIDKGGQRNSMQGPPTAAKPVDNGRISAMYAQPDLTAKKNRRNLNTAPDEEVTLVENSTYATTLPK